MFNVKIKDLYNHCVIYETLNINVQREKYIRPSKNMFCIKNIVCVMCRK